MKIGDRVALKYDAGDLRYPVPIGHVGTVTGGPYEDYRKREWYWVQWYEHEAAMRMWPEELEVLDK